MRRVEGGCKRDVHLKLVEGVLQERNLRMLRTERHNSHTLILSAEMKSSEMYACACARMHVLACHLFV